MNTIKISPRRIYWINKFQDLKTFPTGSADKRDDRINKIIHKIYNKPIKEK